MLVYRMKTHQSPPPGGAWLESLWLVVKLEILNLLRVTLHFLLDFDRKHWRTKSFHLFWKWVTFPLVLPYLMFWEIRFHGSWLNWLPAAHNPWTCLDILFGQHPISRGGEA